MIGLFLITHGTFGEALIQCANHVLGHRPPQLLQLGVSAQDDPAELLPVARDMLAWVDHGHGVLLLSDIYGATPSNIAGRLLQPDRIDGVAGVSLPMLLRCLTHREAGMGALVTYAVSGGQEGVRHMGATA